MYGLVHKDTFTDKKKKNIRMWISPRTFYYWKGHLYFKKIKSGGEALSCELYRTFLVLLDSLGETLTTRKTVAVFVNS